MEEGREQKTSLNKKKLQKEVLVEGVFCWDFANS
jgi:hypothetical protein